jgi:hypothetical protein
MQELPPAVLGDERTLFASRKLPFKILLFAIGLLVNAPKGISSLQANRDLDIHAKTTLDR